MRKRNSATPGDLGFGLELSARGLRLPHALFVYKTEAMIGLEFWSRAPAGVFNCVGKFLDFQDYERLHTALFSCTFRNNRILAAHWSSNLLLYAHHAITPFKSFSSTRALRWTLWEGIDARGWTLQTSMGGGNEMSLANACMANEVDVVEALVERAGVDIHATALEMWPLILAVKKDALDVVKFLCNAGADVNCRDTDGLTALHWAVWSASIETIRYLVCEQGCDVNVAGSAGLLETPLHYVLRCHTTQPPGEGLELLAMLLQRGADKEARSAHGRTPLHYAAAKLDGGEYLDFLCKAGCDVEARSDAQDTPLLAFARLPASPSNFGGGKSLRIAKLLCERYGANVLAANEEDGLTPLTAARLRKNKPLLDYLETQVQALTSSAVSSEAAGEEEEEMKAKKKKRRIALTSV